MLYLDIHLPMLRKLSLILNMVLLNALAWQLKREFFLFFTLFLILKDLDTITRVVCQIFVSSLCEMSYLKYLSHLIVASPFSISCAFRGWEWGLNRVILMFNYCLCTQLQRAQSTVVAYCHLILNIYCNLFSDFWLERGCIFEIAFFLKVPWLHIVSVDLIVVV